MNKKIESLELVYKNHLDLITKRYKDAGLRGRDLMRAVIEDHQLNEIMNSIIEVKGLDSGHSILLSKDQIDKLGL